MSGADLGHAALAFFATTVYYVGFVIFKFSASRMPTLQGSRPVTVIRHMVTDWIFWSGVLVLLVGMFYQVQAFRSLPLGVAQPIFASSLVLLLAFSVLYFGERLSRREWASVALFGTATLLVGLSSESEDLTHGVAGLPVILAVAAPALIIAGLVWIVGDRRANGRHARRIAGVAYGIGAGTCFGMAEVGIKGVAAVYSETGSVHSVITSPYPYVILVMASVALWQLVIALQRVRISILTSVLTVIAKTQLVITGTLVYGEAWPHDPGLLGLRAAGFTLAIAALVLFPRHEEPQLDTGGYPRRQQRSAARSAATRRLTV